MPMPASLSEPARCVLTAVDHALRTIDEATAHDVALADVLDRGNAQHGPERMAEAATHLLLVSALRLQRTAGPQLGEAVSMLRCTPHPGEIAHHAGAAADALDLVTRDEADASALEVERTELLRAIFVRAEDDAVTAVWYAFNGITFLCTIYECIRGAATDLPEHDAIRGHIEELAAAIGIQAPASVV